IPSLTKHWFQLRNQFKTLRDWDQENARLVVPANPPKRSAELLGKNRFHATVRFGSAKFVEQEAVVYLYDPAEKQPIEGGVVSVYVPVQGQWEQYVKAADDYARAVAGDNKAEYFRLFEYALKGAKGTQGGADSVHPSATPRITSPFAQARAALDTAALQ